MTTDNLIEELAAELQSAEQFTCDEITLELADVRAILSALKERERYAIALHHIAKDYGYYPGAGIALAALQPQGEK